MILPGNSITVIFCNTICYVFIHLQQILQYICTYALISANKFKANVLEKDGYFPILIAKTGLIAISIAKEFIVNIMENVWIFCQTYCKNSNFSISKSINLFQIIEQKCVFPILIERKSYFCNLFCT